MKTIVLISCCKEKLHYLSPAEKLYQSPKFKKSLAYARLLKPDAIYILSAKHNVVELLKPLEWYDEKLQDKSEDEKNAWANNCLKSLKEKFDLKNDKFIILAGLEYYHRLIGPNKICNFELPLYGLTQGYALHWLNEHIKEAQND